MLICLSGGAGLPAVPIAASATTVAAIPATVTSATAAAAFTATTAIAVTATATTAAAIAVTATTTATAWAATTEAARGPLFFGTGFHYLDRDRPRSRSAITRALATAPKASKAARNSGSLTE